MARSIALRGALGAIVMAGVARAQVDMALERAARDHDKHMDKLRMDAILGTTYYESEPLDASEIAARGVVNYEQAERRARAHPAFGLPYDESHQLKNPQADIYASAADLISPLPDRLSVNPDSPFYGEYGKIGVRFNGSDRPGDVEEYCVSEGWIRVRTFMANGKPKRERGKFVCLRKHGTVEPYRK